MCLELADIHGRILVRRVLHVEWISCSTQLGLVLVSFVAFLAQGSARDILDIRVIKNQTYRLQKPGPDLPSKCLILRRGQGDSQPSVAKKRKPQAVPDWPSGFVMTGLNAQP